ncbi:MAG: DUF4190 domain-containing protein [Clostridia bacterium]|nr:DUF4190 domain-containing protein [Clostridia bacterium]
MFCRNCGKEIDDNAAVCIHCGVATGKAQPVSNETNVLAIVGFVLSFFTAIIGLICSIIGYKNSKDPRYNGNGRSLAIAGIIISCVATALYIILFVSLISGAACFAASVSTYY